MADNDRWRSDQDRFRYRDDERGSRFGGAGGRDEYGRGYGRGGEFRGRGYGSTGSDYRGGRGTEGRGDLLAGGGAYGGDYRGRDWESDRDYAGGGYGAEGYARGYEDRGYRGGNDYNRGFYGADQGYGGRERGSDRDMWGYRGERSGWDRVSDEVSSWFGDEEAARRREQDARQGDYSAEFHRGRGPKGYKRSDDRIREDVCDRLTDDPRVDASDVEVQVSNCEVTLSGTVDSREAKRRAEDCAERVSGVTHVQNNLRVQQHGATTGTTGYTTAGAAGAGVSGVQGGTRDEGARGTTTGATGTTRRKTSTGL
jgi:osmotically-inducible protein OsmY